MTEQVRTTEEQLAHEKKHKNRRHARLTGALITLLLLAFYFYWFEYRVMQVRSDCAFEASQRAFLNETINIEAGSGLDRIRAQNESFETFYLLCVRSNGVAQ